MENSMEEWGMVESQQELDYEGSTEIQRSDSFLFVPSERRENKLEPIIKEMENSYKRLERVLAAFNRIKWLSYT